MEQKKHDLHFKKVKSSCYINHEHGFYVYVKLNKCNPYIVTKNIEKYLGRPIIATLRIDKYDGENVAFYYNRHENDKYIEETILAVEFIEILNLSHSLKTLKNDSILQNILQHKPSMPTKKVTFFYLKLCHQAPFPIKQKSPLSKGNRRLLLKQ